MTWDDNQGKKLLADLVHIESPSRYVQGIRQVQERVLDALKPLSLQYQWHFTEHGPILEIFRIMPGRQGPLLLAHADTVWPLGTLKTMPLQIQGDRIFGPGVLDMKAGLVIGVGALYDVPADVPFCWLITPDEEIGSALSRQLIEEKARKASVTLVLEPGGNEGALKIGRSGVGNFRMEITGIESHAGLDPDQGASAIRELAQQILWLASLENRVLGTTINVGVVKGGNTTNVVAASAVAEIDIRVKTQKEQERIEKTLNAPPQFDTRTSTRYVGGFNRPPMDHGPVAEQWFRQAAEIWESVRGKPLAGINVGGASDGNFTAAITPTLDGLGAVGQGAHARHEHIEWRFVPWRQRLVHELVVRAGQEPMDSSTTLFND
ncbi:M20 family metallopeptidase [Sulfobacillus thermosulfidooxidans]|uniref:M20 family metallopeptidase n=1 Tax=Sulfobacillus thermosulfidooxidans TaxID=28034 RepID=UPI0006B62A69|nr:M20 family metallopeptidase [Sulfobacillus thermosulfidooxidans]